MGQGEVKIIAVEGEGWPTLTADDDNEWRQRRLAFVFGILCGRLSWPDVKCIYRLHDHEGTLSVGIDAPKDHPSGWRIVREAEAAWSMANEGEVCAYFTPDWPRFVRGPGGRYQAFSLAGSPRRCGTRCRACR
jgi:hypothetical protein